MTALGPVHQASGRAALGRHETEAGARLHAGALAASCCCSTSRPSASIRCRGASCGRSSCTWSGREAHRARQHLLPRRGGALRARACAARGAGAGAWPARDAKVARRVEFMLATRRADRRGPCRRACSMIRRSSRCRPSGASGLDPAPGLRPAALLAARPSSPSESSKMAS